VLFSGLETKELRYEYISFECPISDPNIY